MHRLKQLLVTNQRLGTGVRAVHEGERSVIFLHGVIDDLFGVSAIDIAKALADAGGRDVQLKINSPGGGVDESRAMIDEIRNYSGRVLATIQGVAASAATSVALAADEVEMSDGALFMIHNSMTIAFGNAVELRDTADLLQKVDGIIAADYVRKTGISESEVRAMMNAETWMDAGEAFDRGFVDRVTGAPDEEPNNRVWWDLSCYDKAPNSPTAQPGLSASDRAAMERRLQLIERGHSNAR